jgi:RNA 2',3'-cyclic 3'-phosphodiesterase
VESDESLRLFCALRLPAEVADELVRWQTVELEAARARLRLVPRENLHLTLAFLGSTARDALPGIVEALVLACSGMEPPLLEPIRYRETRSVGMIVCSDEQGRAGELAVRLSDRLERLGVDEGERRRWVPHVTVARFRERPGLTPALPSLGGIVPSDAAVMISRLRRGGAQYEVFESVSLGG